MTGEIVHSLMMTGGLGLLNYLILDRLNIVDIHSNHTSTIAMLTLLWTLIDWSIYELTLVILNKYLTGTMMIMMAVTLTVITSFLLTTFLAIPVHRVLNKIFASTLHMNNLASIETGNVWWNLMRDNQATIAYLYDFNHQPQGWGYIDMASADEKSNYSLILQPFNQERGIEQDSYESISKRIQEEEFRQKYVAKQFVDFNQKFIVITLQQAN